jgi:hypothetical protein
MPSPKSGTAGTPVEPAEPHAAAEADVADPGAVEEAKAAQVQSQSGKYGEQKFKGHKPPADAAEEALKSSWIEIELIGEDDSPVVGQAYRLLLADNTVIEGTLDEKGLARIEGIEPGTCRLTFPDLDGEAWEKA